MDSPFAKTFMTVTKTLTPEQMAKLQPVLENGQQVNGQQAGQQQVANQQVVQNQQVNQQPNPNQQVPQQNQQVQQQIQMQPGEAVQFEEPTSFDGMVTINTDNRALPQLDGNGNIISYQDPNRQPMNGQPNPQGQPNGQQQPVQYQAPNGQQVGLIGQQQGFQASGQQLGNNVVNSNGVVFDNAEFERLRADKARLDRENETLRENNDRNKPWIEALTKHPGAEAFMRQIIEGKPTMEAARVAVGMEGQLLPEAAPDPRLQVPEGMTPEHPDFAKWQADYIAASTENAIKKMTPVFEAQNRIIKELHDDKVARETREQQQAQAQTRATQILNTNKDYLNKGLQAAGVSNFGQLPQWQQDLVNQNLEQVAQREGISLNPATLSSKYMSELEWRAMVQESVNRSNQQILAGQGQPAQQQQPNQQAMQQPANQQPPVQQQVIYQNQPYQNGPNGQGGLGGQYQQPVYQPGYQAPQYQPPQYQQQQAPVYQQAPMQPPPFNGQGAQAPPMRPNPSNYLPAGPADQTLRTAPPANPGMRRTPELGATMASVLGG